MAILTKVKGKIVLSSDKRKLQVSVVLDFLANSYWARGIEQKLLKQSLKNSHCYGLYHNGQQIGFARVVTDFTRNAYLADVFINEQFQSRGLGKFMIKNILNDPSFDPHTKWILATRDAHSFYKQFGFKELENAKRYMQH